MYSFLEVQVMSFRRRFRLILNGQLGWKTKFRRISSRMNNYNSVIRQNVYFTTCFI